MDTQTKSITSCVSLLEGKLLEYGGLGSGPTESKTTFVFDVLDSVVSQLGVFKEIMKTCRNELFDAVYSTDFTASQSSTDDNQCYMHRVPYFVINQRIMDSRDEHRDDLQQQINQLQSQLHESRQDITSIEQIAAALKLEKEQKEIEVENLTKKVQDQLASIESLKNEINVLRKASDDRDRYAEFTVKCLKTDLQDSLDKITDILPFKKGYDRLQTAFYQQTVMEGYDRSKVTDDGKSRPASSFLHADIDSCNHLKQQLLSAQNSLIEEYDKYLEDHNKQVSLKFPVSGSRARAAVQHDVADDSSSQMKEYFKAGIDAIDEELNMLQVHQQLMEAHLTELSVGKTSARKDANGTNEQLQKELRGKTDSGELHLDPFVSHERILNKYAVMLYMSEDKGKSFIEFPETFYCASCGEKTVVCPHRYLVRDQVFKIKPTATHLKLARLRLPANSARFTTGQLVASRQPEMGADFMWLDYSRRTDKRRLVPRPLTKERTISLIYQFSQYLLDQDSDDTDNDSNRQPCSVLDSLYAFVKLRYADLDVSYLAGHDFISSLDIYSPESMLIFLVRNVLNGLLSATTLRYVLLLTDLLSTVKWSNVENLKKVLAILYPFLNDDDLEMHQLEYVSFSENKHDSSRLVAYIIDLIMKHQEPQFLETETTLLCRPGKDIDQMTEDEFFHATEETIFTCSDRLVSHLYRETAASFRQRNNCPDAAAVAVPVDQLAQIASYLGLLGCAARIKHDMQTLVPQLPVADHQQAE